MKIWGFENIYKYFLSVFCLNVSHSDGLRKSPGKIALKWFLKFRLSTFRDRKIDF